MKNKQVKELVERVRLKPKERPETTKELGARGSNAMPDEIFQAGVVAGAEAQLNKVLNSPDLALIDKDAFECPECGQGNFIPLAEALKEEDERILKT